MTEGQLALDCIDKFAFVNCRKEESPKDSRRVALIDTACTLCMHSAAWRKEFEERLPEGITCEPAKQKRSSTVALD